VETRALERITRPRTRERAVAAAESVAFPELVWAHFLHQREVHETGDVHGPAEAEYRSQLERFVEENGRVVNAYWCTSEASGVALTEKPGTRVAGFLWRRPPEIRFHSATDWVTKDTPDIGHVLHTCETLAIRVREVLGDTTERIAMQWILAVAGYVLGVVDRNEGKPAEAEATSAVRRARTELARVETYYDRAGENVGRLVYFSGMMIGVAALVVVGVLGAAIYSLFGTFHMRDSGTQMFFICYAMGAAGAIVSVMARMTSSGPGKFAIDYEVGRAALRRVGSFRPAIGAIFAVVLYFALRGDLIQLQTTSDEHAKFFYAALAFFAGFSERRAKIILGGAERVLGDGTEPPDEEPPHRTARRSSARARGAA